MKFNHSEFLNKHNAFGKLRLMKKDEKQFSIILLVGLVLLIIAWIFEFRNEVVFFVCSIGAILSSGVAITKQWKKPLDIERNLSENQSFERPTLMISVSAALYAVLAGFAVVTALNYTFTRLVESLRELESDISLISIETMNEAISNNVNELIMAGVFLSTAVPFYHGAMVYLSDKSRNVDIETKGGLAFHFFILFIQAVLLLGIANSLESITFVITLLIALMVIDSFWIIFGQRTKNKPPLGWLCLNLGFTAAIIISLHLNAVPLSLYMLFAASILRSVFDYLGFREVYTKY